MKTGKRKTKMEPLNFTLGIVKMARKKQILRSYGQTLCDEKITETTTLKMNLPEGGFIRTDGNGFWIVVGATKSLNGSYYGEKPAEWDESRAEKDDFSRSRTEFGVDYS